MYTCSTHFLCVNLTIHFLSCAFEADLDEYWIEEDVAKAFAEGLVVVKP